MGLRESLRQLIGQVGGVSELARVDRVAALVPTDAEYVTVGPLLVLADAVTFIGGPPGHGPFGRSLAVLPEIAGQAPELSLLVLAGRRLRVISPGGERWSCSAADVTDLDGRRDTGFVLVTRDGGGLAVAHQSPVQVPAGASWRTVRGVTTLFSGWNDILSRYGARSW
ncbi:hypothetical protein [uncultured Friedmanniella sp.]|uniref:hypothetical protein n=1 Tax=uncultured Friedmanniella sp. TaxID=335381 RepID=UPI0035CB84C2